MQVAIGLFPYTTIHLGFWIRCLSPSIQSVVMTHTQTTPKCLDVWRYSWSSNRAPPPPIYSRNTLIGRYRPPVLTLYSRAWLWQVDGWSIRFSIKGWRCRFSKYRDGRMEDWCRCLRCLSYIYSSIARQCSLEQSLLSLDLTSVLWTKTFWTLSKDFWTPILSWSLQKPPHWILSRGLRPSGRYNPDDDR